MLIMLQGEESYWFSLRKDTLRPSMHTDNHYFYYRAKSKEILLIWPTFNNGHSKAYDPDCF